MRRSLATGALIAIVVFPGHMGVHNWEYVGRAR